MRAKIEWLKSFGICMTALALSGVASAQEFDTNEKQLAEIYGGDYTGKTYSPYAERDFASRPLFGETVGSRFMKPRKSKAMAKPIHTCRRTMSLRTTRPGPSEISI